MRGGDNLEAMRKRVEIDMMSYRKRWSVALGQALWQTRCSSLSEVGERMRLRRCALGGANWFPASPNRDYNLRTQCHELGVLHDGDFIQSDKTIGAFVANLLDLRVSS